MIVLSFNFQHGCHTLWCPFGSAAWYGSCIDIAIETQGLTPFGSAAWYGSCIDIAIETQGLKCGLVWLMYQHSDRNSRSEVRPGMAHVST